ncbi:MAG: amidohydrolase family protein [Planctomycetota bacterium]
MSSPEASLVRGILCSWALAGAVVAAPQQPVAFVGVDVLPMDRERVLRDHTVVVADGRIAAIGPRVEVTPPAAATVVNGRGKSLLPGLVDMHIHLDDPEFDDLLHLHLRHGVTTVQSMHGSPRHLQLRDRIARGELVAPRLVTTGPTTATERVNTPAKAERVVAAQSRAGYDAIKMYGDGSDSMSRETYAALIAAAHARDLRVVGHAPRNHPFSLVVELRQDSIDHMEEVIYTHLPILKAMGPLTRLQFGRGDAAQVERALAKLGDLTTQLRPAAQELARSLREAGTTVTPTLVTFETILRQTTPEYDAMLEADELRFVHPITRANWGPARNRYRNGSWKPRLAAISQVLARSFEVQMMLVQELDRAGVRLLAGTDAPLLFVYPGASLHHELGLLVRAGLTPFNALVAATRAPAEELGLANHIGTVAVGKVADLVLVDGDPLTDIEAAANVVGVVRAGHWLPRSTLDARCDQLAQAHAAPAAVVERLVAALDRDDVDAAVAAWRTAEAADPRVADFLESEINRLGYAALGATQVERARELFALNCELFPDAFNTWDSLAELSLGQGDHKRALTLYRKSLELEPTNANATRMIEGVLARLEALTGHWIGWAYTEDGEDFPLRLHVEREADDALRITLDSPGADHYGIALTDPALHDGELRFARDVDDATRNEYCAHVEDGMLRGTAARNGDAWYAFELGRAPSAIEPADPARARDAWGLYRDAAGELVQIAAWPWNDRELWVHELTTGRRRSAFAADADRYWLGPVFGAMGTPATSLEFERDAAGAIAELRWTAADEPPRSLARVAITREPFAFARDGVELHGDLLLPPGDATALSAVVVHGGGSWRERADAAEFAEAFAALGFAALCYDKRGSGASGGDRPNAFAAIAGDSVAALQRLRRHPSVAPDRVGFFGFSRGGWHAPLAASMTADAAFVVSLAGPAVSPVAQETTRRLNALRDRGVATEELAPARDYLAAQWRYATADAGWDTYAAARTAMAERGWLSTLGGWDKPDEAGWRWWRLNGAYDPLPAIRRLTCPTLAILGGADSNVTAAENAAPWREALSAAPLDASEVRIVPRADHMMFLVHADGSRPRLHELGPTAPNLWPEIAAWVRAALARQR